MDKKTVSIGIPAYNEEANIRHLLLSLLSQISDNFILKEIIVISDGSSDNTAQEVRSVSDPRILLRDDGLRKGQAARQNEILDLFSGEILVLLNADVLPKNDTYLHYMIEPFYHDSKLGIVSNSGTPLPAKNTFEKIINYSVVVRYNMAVSWNSGNNIYLCHGHNRAFSRAFAKKFRFGPAVSEDAYSYLKCGAMEYKFFYQPKAAVWYRSPQNLEDHLKQSTRFFRGVQLLEQYFPKEIVQSSFNIPFSITVKHSIRSFFIHPFLFTAYCYILLLSKIKTLAVPKANSDIWEPSASSKNL